VSPNERAWAGGTLPADATAGAVLESICNLKGARYVQQQNLDPSTDVVATTQKRVAIVATGLVGSLVAYTAGDAVGGKLTFVNATRVAAGSGLIESLIFVDQDNDKVAIDVVFFHTDLATAPVDNAAFDIADADLLNVIGFVSILSADYISAVDNAVAVKLTSLPFKLPSGTSLYAAIINRGVGTLLPTATSDYQLTAVIRQD
jgi:hypothetical protein